jgi:hypothetical protein
VSRDWNIWLHQSRNGETLNSLAQKRDGRECSAALEDQAIIVYEQ